MNPIVRNIAAVVTGAVIGSIVNMGFIMAGGALIPAPAGADVTTMEGLKEAMHLFGPQNFIFPFLAHAGGTFAGATVALMIAASHKMKLAYGVSVLFLAGGTANAFMLPAPLWFIVLDLVAAYIPMAYLAGKIILREK